MKKQEVFLPSRKLFEYIQKKQIPSWGKTNTCWKLDECEAVNGIFYTENKGEITGIALILPNNENNFHCSLIVTDSRKEFVDIVKQFKKRFPEGKIETAERHGKKVKYKQHLTNRIIKFYG